MTPPAPPPQRSPAEPTLPLGTLFAAITGWVTIAVGVLVIVGWSAHVRILTSALPGSAPMKPFTAVALIALGIALVVSAVPQPDLMYRTRRLMVARACACVPLLIGVMMGLQYIVDVSFGIDLLLFRQTVLDFGGMLPGRISPATSVNLSLLGLSVLCLDSRSLALRWLAQWPALIAAVIAFIAVLGYLYGAEHLYEMHAYASVAVHTAVLIAAIGGALLLMRPDRSVARELFGRYHGGFMARRVLPIAIVLPVVVGWARLQGQNAGWFPTEVGLALFAAANVLIFSMLIYLSARLLNRMDADRRGADFRRLRGLREAETRWRALAEASSQIVWTAGPNGEPDDSPSMREFTGQTLEQWLTDGMEKVTHPDDWPRMTAIWHNAIATRTPFEAEFRLRHVSREWRWVSVRGVPVAHAADSHVAWVGMNRDITEKRQAQALTDGQKHVLELIARGAPLAETLNALTRLIEAQNQDMLCSILLLDSEGAHLRHGAAPRLPAEYTRAIDGVAIGPTVGSCGTAAFTGKAVYVEDIATDPLWKDYKHIALPHGLRACWSTPIQDAGGKVLGTFAIYYTQPALPTERHIRLIDLATQTAAICLSRHNQVQALQDSERRFRQLAEALPQLVWTCKPQGECDYLSRQWAEYTGIPAADQLGYAWGEQVHPADRESAIAAWKSAIAGGSEFRYEYRIRRHDGTYRWFDTRAIPQHDASGHVTKWIGSNTDIDDRKRFEESQLRSQKLESLGTLAGGIAHDFNNMLLVIQGNAQLAQELIEQHNPVQEHLVEITHASERASDLVRRILSFSRPQKAQKARHKVISLRPVVDEAIRFARAALPAMVEIRAKIASQVPPVSADATQIHQILLNLATNAAHAIGLRGGLIEIELTGVDVDAEVVACTLDDLPKLAPGRYARLTVRDNGSGMSPETLERVFDPFFTTKPVGQGTGLGLSIVHGIMRSCGGAVTVQSQLGKGTSFHLFFPAAAEANLSDVTDIQVALARGGGQRVLFIDDEDAVVRLATLNLTRLGYQVTGCTDPAMALREFERSPQSFDVVVTDLSMPGMSGFDCAREMLGRRPDLPILLTSGYLRPEDEAQAREIGIRAVCGKPEALNELGSILQQILRPVSSSAAPAAVAAGSSDP